MADTTTSVNKVRVKADTMDQKGITLNFSGVKDNVSNAELGALRYAIEQHGDCYVHVPYEDSVTSVEVITTTTVEKDLDDLPDPS